MNYNNDSGPQGDAWVSMCLNVANTPYALRGVCDKLSSLAAFSKRDPPLDSRGMALCMSLAVLS